MTRSTRDELLDHFLDEQDEAQANGEEAPEWAERAIMALQSDDEPLSNIATRYAKANYMDWVEVGS